MTIVDCIVKTLHKNNTPLTIQEIYQKIVEDSLYQFNTKDPISVVRQQVRRHCKGIDFPSALPNKHFIQTSVGKYTLIEEQDTKEPLPKDSKDKIPEEHIQEFHKKHILELRTELIDRLLTTHPSFFEQLVLDLLLKIGYGTNGSIKRRGPGPDGGVDGEILQDKLGFDRIYMQAKRYALNRPVSDIEIKQFVGSLEHITRGVFITTSRFTSKAEKYAQSQQQKSLVLIDGEKLSKLMIENQLGIQITHTYHTYRIDSDYFGNGET